MTEALPDDDRSSILRRADRALYAAKEGGRNRTRIGFDRELTTPGHAHKAKDGLPIHPTSSRQRQRQGSWESQAFASR